MFKIKELKGCIVRWIEILLVYDFLIEYRFGYKYGNVDVLLRCFNFYSCECFVDIKLKCGFCKKCIKRNEEFF